MNMGLRWFGHVERKDDNDWVKCSMTWQLERIKTESMPKKTWWDCFKNDMENLGPVPKGCAVQE